MKKHPIKFTIVILVLFFLRPMVLWIIYDVFRVNHFNMLPDFGYWEVFFLCIFFKLFVKGIDSEKIKEAFDEDYD